MFLSSLDWVGCSQYATLVTLLLTVHVLHPSQVVHGTYLLIQVSVPGFGNPRGGSETSRHLVRSLPDHTPSVTPGD